MSSTAMQRCCPSRHVFCHFMFQDSQRSWTMLLRTEPSGVLDVAIGVSVSVSGAGHLMLGCVGSLRSMLLVVWRSCCNGMFLQDDLGL